MKRTISWGLFFIVPLMFILSLVWLDIVSIVLVMAGCVAAGLVFLYDVICKLFFVKEQIFKFFCYALLFVRFGQLYEYPLVTDIALALALVCAFVMVICFAIKANDVIEDVRQIDK